MAMLGDKDMPQAIVQTVIYAAYSELTLEWWAAWVWKLVQQHVDVTDKLVSQELRQVLEQWVEQLLTKLGAHVGVTLIGHQAVVNLEHLVTVITGQNVVQVDQVKVDQD
jgi:hypothetical protein